MKKITLLIISLLFVVSTMAFTACSDPHEHSFGTELQVSDTHHYYVCECGEKKDETAHVFDKEIASIEYLKAEATATTKAQYYKSCVCGKASATEFFEIDKTVSTLANIQDLSKTYDKVELANPTYETNSDGAVTVEWYQGDTKLDAKPVNAGTYKVKVIIAESATYTGISAEKEFTIAKKVLSGLTAELTYDGTNSFEVPLVETNGILAGDVADGIKVCITFANKNVGAAVTSAGLDADDGDNYTNYELDLTTCTASIVPKVIDNLTYEFEYNGFEYQSVTFEDNDIPGIIENDSLFLEVCFATPDVGWELDTSDETGFKPGFNETNYVLGENYNFSIVPKPLTVPTLLKDYNGNNTVSYAFTDTDGLLSGDSCTLTFDVTATDVGYYEDTAMIGVALTNTNYKIEVSTCDLHILDSNDLVMLVTNKYNLEGDFILVVEIKQGSVKVGDSIVLPGTLDKVYEVLVIEKINKQIEFATVGDEVGLYVSGMTDLSEVPGASFLYEEDNIPKMVTEFLAEVHMLAEGGRQTPIFDFNNYKPNMRGLGASQEINITPIDVYESDNDTTLNPGGTAFVKITLTTELPACLLGTVTFKLYEGTKYVGNAEYVDLVVYDSFAKALVVNCDTAYSETMQVRTGQKVYIKINGADGTLNDFYFKATTGSTATFTYEEYNVTDTTTPIGSETTATNTYAMDINGTDDRYVVITCVTAGEISIIVE